jgi:hypothetical protein
MDLINILGLEKDFVISVFLTGDGKQTAGETAEKVKYAWHPLWRPNTIHMAALLPVSLSITKEMTSNLKGYSQRLVRSVLI